MGYVLALTALMIAAGAAGILNFERGTPGSPIRGYWDALWWTAMIMTTMGTEYFPRSPEGRLLCVVLAVYAFAVFGYVTATLATLFIDHDAKDPDAELHRELRAIRNQLEQLGAAPALVDRPEQ